MLTSTSLKGTLVSDPKNLEIELELTYLARELPAEIAGISPRRLFDIYVPEQISRPFIRLRQKGDQYEITKKKPLNDNDSSIQSEQTIPLDKEEFSALSTSSKRSVEKDRYQVGIDGNMAEVDVFTGALEGLVVIDFEFKSIEDMQAFTPPSCCLVEVTQELFIAGGQLAGRTYADIEDDLARYKYVKVVA